MFWRLLCVLVCAINCPKLANLASTQGAGSRTGGETAQAKVELLVPKDHVAFTTKARPTFFWYVSKVPSAPVEFALHQQGVAAPILVKRVDITQAGLVKLEMPLDAPELTLDTTKNTVGLFQLSPMKTSDRRTQPTKLGFNGCNWLQKR
ncbi:MAG: DUF928 domain-containing protein [Leptolyngbyaceae cyanobacterium SU_3_3]|nr:DUF928 domain-containing protein [Leptolyngbyaceae cyanobacterium SU_3_3]